MPPASPEVVVLLQHSIAELAVLPAALSAAANTPQFVPSNVREMLHEGHRLAIRVLSQFERVAEKLLPQLNKSAVTIKRLEDKMSGQCLQLSQLQAELQQVNRIASQRLIVSVLRSAAHLARVRNSKETVPYPIGNVALVALEVADLARFRSSPDFTEAVALMHCVVRRVVRKWTGFLTQQRSDGRCLVAFQVLWREDEGA
eukprot:NODE_3828_length_910_cov_19.216028_g3522_i0.p1 GENE.NODE_3828_length_910_cov_19.216028_g3522_i0~~NODE_3828_length_910_cov_19.216028_g3522_i0.p1  ORF type:complete len:201 (+),score=33.91 NODE_3828_length_910_cov_19.216028_g3522_i0:198-800(+)